MSSTESIDHAEALRAGPFVFCSGQIGIEQDGSNPVSPARQFELAFAALRNALQRHGCDLCDIVDLTTFHVGYPSHMAEFMTVKSNALSGARCAWTAIGVQALGYPGSLVEIKAIAAARSSS